MTYRDTKLSGVYVVQTEPIRDERGAFARLFCSDELRPIFGNRQVSQINHSRTNQVGAVRGLHFQRPPFAEMKIVRCLRGKVWDVAVDLRHGSPTYLQWFGIELGPGLDTALVVPEGCAHGFQVLEPGSELLYLHTCNYMPSFEGGLRFNDPAINVYWPLPAVDLSRRDQNHPELSESFEGLRL